MTKKASRHIKNIRTKFKSKRQYNKKKNLKTLKRNNKNVIKKHTKTKTVKILKGGFLSKKCDPKDRQFFIINSRNESKCAPIFQTNTSSILNVNTLNKLDNASCFDEENINRMVRAYNNKHPNDIINTKNSKTRLYQLLKQKMTNYCTDGNELCWTKQKFIKDEFGNELLEFNFKPIIPDTWYCNKREWLNTLDIDNVLHQYQQKYPEFVSMGPTPIDFDHKIGGSRCVTDELCKINLKQLINQNKKYIGVVFNLDTHKESGSHWIAMFCNLPKKEICYWDSYGYQPPKEVKVLMSRLKKQGDNLGTLYNNRIYQNNSNLKKFLLNKKNKFAIKINKKRHQFKNSECGVYCINFIISLLEGETFENITKNVIKDDDMNKLRSKYFLPL